MRSRRTSSPRRWRAASPSSTGRALASRTCLPVPGAALAGTARKRKNASEAARMIEPPRPGRSRSSADVPACDPARLRHPALAAASAAASPAAADDRPQSLPEGAGGAGLEGAAVAALGAQAQQVADDLGEHVVVLVDQASDARRAGLLARQPAALGAQLGAAATGDHVVEAPDPSALVVVIVSAHVERDAHLLEQGGVLALGDLVIAVQARRERALVAVDDDRAGTAGALEIAPQPGELLRVAVLVRVERHEVHAGDVEGAPWRAALVARAEERAKALGAPTRARVLVVAGRRVGRHPRDERRRDLEVTVPVGL